MSKKKGCLIVAGVILVGIIGVVVVIGVIGGMAAKDVLAKAKAQEQARIDAPISAVTWSEINEIYSLKSTTTELQKDEIWKKYKGQKVKWSGTVSSVSETMGDLQLQVKMNPESFSSDVILTLKETSRADALALKKGDPVTFVAILSRWGSLMPVSLDHGEIVK